MTAISAKQNDSGSTACGEKKNTNWSLKEEEIRYTLWSHIWDKFKCLMFNDVRCWSNIFYSTEYGISLLENMKFSVWRTQKSVHKRIFLKNLCGNTAHEAFFISIDEFVNAWDIPHHLLFNNLLLQGSLFLHSFVPLRISEHFGSQLILWLHAIYHAPRTFSCKFHSPKHFPALKTE